MNRPKFNSDRAWVRAERTAAKIGFVLAVVGLAEKSYHYAVLVKREYERKRHPNQFGIQPTRRSR